MKPAWWQLYGLVVFLVMLLGVIEVSIPTGILRTILESVRAGTAPMTARADLERVGSIAMRPPR